MERITDEALAITIPSLPEREANVKWEELCQRNEILLRNIARRAGLQEPRDLVTDLYRHLKGPDADWRRLAGFRPQSAPFTHWLAVVACRVARSRAPRRPEQISLEDVAREPSVEPVRLDRVALLIALGKLGHAECRVLIRRRYWNGEGFEDLAPGMGRSPDALRQLHFRNIKELRGILNDGA